MTGMRAIGRLGWIQMDAVDPLQLAAFWGKVLGRQVDEPLGDPPHYVGLVASGDDVIVSFQRVPDGKTVKNRLHFDIEVADVDLAQTRIEALGGRRLAMDDFAEHGFSWRQMADPEGNEFCLIFDAVDGT
jgi:predicted enzyme related to lactoylglutathione lyase